MIRRILATTALAVALAPLAQPAQASTDSLLALGDSWTQGVGDRDPSNGLGWSPVAAQILGAALTQDGAGGSGYVNPTAYGDNVYDHRLYRHPADGYRTVIVQGSTNDKAYLASLAGNANKTLNALKNRYPSARIVVVGPTAVNGAPDNATLAVNAKLRTAAAVAGLPYVDAIGEGWFVPGDWSRYSDAATGHPNDAGYRVIGQRIAADVARLP